MIGESIGNYRIVAKLGQGGMGTVYHAEDAQLGRKVAVKVLNPGLMEQGGRELERFKSEAKVQASLSNPNVVTLYDFVPYGDSFCMVMEFVDGRSLSELLRSVGALPPHIVVAISKQILEGLSAAHRLGVVHRDLKPSNVLLTPEGVAKVMDFGIAKVQGSKGLTATGALVGTVYYMSPEQVRGEPVDARSDLYSFGVILFELLTGRVPFKDDSDFKIMVHHVQTPPPLPTQLLPEIPGDLEDIVVMCLKKNAAERFQSADAILAALDSFEEQERAAGRGQLYTRRYLAQWLSAPTNVQAPAATDQAPLAAPAQTPLPRVEPSTSANRPVGPPSLADRPSSPAIHPEPPESLSVQGAPAARKRTMFFVIPLILIVLVGAAAAYYLLKNRPSPTPNATGQAPIAQDTTQPPIQQPTAQPPAEQATAQLATEQAARPPAEQAAGRPNLAGFGQQTAAAPGVAPPTPIGGAPRTPEPRQVTRAVAAPTPTGAAAVRTATGVAKATVAGRRSAGEQPAAAIATTIPPVQADVPKLPQGFLIFIDADESSEKLPLASAQSQIADIVRQAGYQVISTGAGAQGVRTALDQGDLASIRSRGVGFVVLGTASGSLESQSAYGATYNVAKVTVNLELLRMSDGAVVSHGSGDATSRGSANAASALSEALLKAISDGAREMMGQFRP